MRRYVRLASAFYVAQVMGVLGFIDSLVYPQWEGKGGDKLTQSLNSLQIVICIFLFTQSLRQEKTLRTGAILTLAMVGFLFVSAGWSVDPSTTVRRGVIYLFVVLGAIGIASRLDGNEYMYLVASVCGGAAILSLVLFFIAHSWVVAGSGDFHGIFPQKNVFGQVMLIGALASLHGLRIGGRKRLMNVTMLILNTIAAVWSKSSTSFLIIVAMCAVDTIVTLFRKGGASRAIGVLLTLVMVPTGLILGLFSDSIFEVVGKDTTLTGRTDLWPYVLDVISQRPILGWGYSAFWLPTNPAALEISKALGWNVPQAHNGILEMLVEVGIVGTIVFLVLWIRNVKTSISCLGTPAQDVALSSLYCCGSILVSGVTEEVLVDPNQASVSVFLITGYMCERALRARRRRRSVAVSGAFPQNRLTLPLP